jgi:hypothetical protein
MATTTAPRKTTTLHACECSKWEFDLDVERDDDYSTGCTAQTKRIFAQGHDAKLVGFMVRAELAGHDISRTDGGVLVTFGGAVHAAGKISEALAVKAEAMLTAQVAKATKKRHRTEVKAAGAKLALAEYQEAKQAKAEIPPIEAEIKVGRWTYPALVETVSGEATYTAKSGVVRTLARGEYILLP